MPETAQAVKDAPEKAPRLDKKNEFKPNKKDGFKPGKRSKGPIVAVIVIVMLVAAAAVLLYMNIFRIRDMTYDLLRKVPIVGSLVPEAEETPEDKYAGMTMDEFAAKNQSLERELERLRAELSDSQTKNDLYVREIARLSEFEGMQEQYLADKDAFDREIFDRDPLAYKKYYDQISPKNAETFYKEAVVIEQASAEVKSYLSKIGGMDEKAAAAALEELIPTDIDLVVYIMRGLGDDKASLVLENMSRANAAIVIKVMYPE